MTREQRAAVVIGAAVLVTGLALGSQLRVAVPQVAPRPPSAAVTPAINILGWDAAGGVAWVAAKESGSPNGRSAIFRTRDGGHTWDRVPNPIPTAFPNQVQILGDQAVLVMVRDESAGTPELFIGRGDAWRPVTRPPFEGTPAVDFGPRNLAWAWSSNGAMARSRDLGSTWERLPAPIGAPLLHQLDGTEGWVAVDEGRPAFYRTRDGGSSWEREAAPPGAGDILSRIFHRPDGTVVVASSTGASSDVMTRGGGGWTIAPGPPGAHFTNDAEFGVAVDGTYWLLAERAYWRSDGTGWHALATAIPAGLSILSVRPNRLGLPEWALAWQPANPAAGTTLIRSVDDGQTWSAVRLPTVPAG